MIIEKNYIFLQQRADNKAQVLADIAQKAKDLGISNHRQATLDALLARENEISTDLGIGIAIPHAKTDSVNRVSILFYRSESLIQWDEENQSNVFLVFLTPASSINNIHLQMLAEISRKLVNEEFKQMLINSQDSEQIYQGIKSAVAKLEENN